MFNHGWEDTFLLVAISVKLPVLVVFGVIQLTLANEYICMPTTSVFKLLICLLHIIVEVAICHVPNMKLQYH